MAVTDVANLLLSGAALSISFVALRISRRQVTLDERSLRIAQREFDVAEQERAARSALVVDIDWEPTGGVSRMTSMNCPFTATITIRNDGERDATDVAVSLLVPPSAQSGTLAGGQPLPRIDKRSVNGTAVAFRPHERLLDRVRKVPEQVVGTVDVWRVPGTTGATGTVTTPVIIEVRCADQPTGREVQTFEHTLTWLEPGS